MIEQEKADQVESFQLSFLNKTSPTEMIDGVHLAYRMLETRLNPSTTFENQGTLLEVGKKGIQISKMVIAEIERVYKTPYREISEEQIAKSVVVFTDAVIQRLDARDPEGGWESRAEEILRELRSERI